MGGLKTRPYTGEEAVNRLLKILSIFWIKRTSEPGLSNLIQQI